MFFHTGTVILAFVVCQVCANPHRTHFNHRGPQGPQHFSTFRSGNIRSTSPVVSNDANKEINFGPPVLESTPQSDPNVPQSSPFRIKDNPECVNREEAKIGYCEEDPEYDDTVKERFEEILKNDPINNMIIDVLKETKISVPGPITLRGGFTTEQTPCPSTETIIYPKRGQTANNDWVFVLNQGNVQQGVKVEKCLTAGSQCQFGGSGFPLTTCRQKYIYRKLLTMDSRGSNIVSESVYLPSCCVCYISSDFVSPRISKSCPVT